MKEVQPDDEIAERLQESSRAETMAMLHSAFEYRRSGKVLTSYAKPFVSFEELNQLWVVDCCLPARFQNWETDEKQKPVDLLSHVFSIWGSHS